jgi:MoaA/NifB/PqqE/SkfB family radical SAM enzyme
MLQSECRMSSFLAYAQTLGRYLVRQQQVHLIVHVTNHCNYRCRHCFVDFSPKRDLSLEQYQSLGREAGPLFWLDIGGGEPFLRKDLAEIVLSFDARVVQIPSNGSLPDLMVDQVHRMLEGMGGRELIVSLSLDGLEATHDAIRGEAGSWTQVWRTFERLRGTKGLYLKVLTVLQNGNAHEIVPLMEEVRRRAPDYHSVILLRGATLDPSVRLPDMGELRRLGREIFKVQETYDYGRGPLAAHVLRNFHRYVWNLSLRTLEEKRQVIPCLAGRAHMVVMGDGGVSSCEMLPPVGDLRRQSWAEIKASAALEGQVAGIRAGKCHCTHNCAMLDSIWFSPARLPHLAWQTVR